MKIKRLSFLLSSVLFLFVFCVSANAYVNKNTAVVYVLNKAAGKVKTINLPVGQPASYEKLTLFVHACKQTDPFAAENFFMFINVLKSEDNEIFSGWMNRNEPGNNPLQDADYDIWLLSCE